MRSASTPKSILLPRNVFLDYLSKNQSITVEMEELVNIKERKEKNLKKWKWGGGGVH